MKIRNKLFNIHALYNLSRYAFLKIEYDYNNILKKSNITLPQLRILWIIKAFPGISALNIAKIGCWSAPTVTKILKILLANKLIYKDDSHNNKKLYKLNLTSLGENYITINKQKNKDDFVLFSFLNLFSNDEIDFVLHIFKNIILKTDNNSVFEYVEKINNHSIKIDYSTFVDSDTSILKKIVSLYNYLRVFTLTIEGNHRNLLTKFNITYPQLRALWIIEAFPGITSVVLSKLAFLSPSTTNVIVKNLYAKNLLYKEKSSIKNSLFLHITEKGEKLLIDDFRINQINFSIFKSLEDIPQKDIISINKLLLKINKNLHNTTIEEYINKTFTVIEKRLLKKGLSVNH